MPTEAMPPDRHRLRALRRGLGTWLGALGLAATAAFAAWRPPLPEAEPAGPSASAIAGPDAGPACISLDTPPRAGRHDDERTADGLKLHVVAPADLEPRRAYGLVIAYPPAGHAAAGTERTYGFTAEATARGWIVAYPDALPLGERAVDVQRRVLAHVAARWCLDPARVLLAGHSDGGTLAQAAAFRAVPGELRPTALVASASGLRAEDLARESCPPPMSVTIVHNPRDARFPDRGAGLARWWADCWGCRLDDAPPPPGTCVEAQACGGGAAVRHCASTEAHERWPVLAARAVADRLTTPPGCLAHRLPTTASFNLTPRS